ncbi:hypothetical protein U0X36_26125 [Bacillus thuringiensis]|uniref:Uncharacterized protein n=1 Tax=Bacillus cereus (strain VD146) TaxID=1053236 RepID=R8MEW7_BACCX|nr:MULTISPECIES: hypothetical protein [Bacillus cereus group]EOP32298.1 hypothetical protein IK1_05834 [Bacillus cereus VD146]MDZ3956293.1 hypothetical protein [Bacillus thuringiensis]RGP42998.1 hypothetical protein BTW32_30370 [Bacillus thuringiensis]
MGKKKKSKNQVPEKTVQDLIPVRNIYNEMIETLDNRIIKILSVSAVNTTLMSYAEEREVLANYEIFLKSLDKPIQINRTSIPVNLTDYINHFKENYFSSTNKFKRKMQQSYIWYAKNIQDDKDMIRRSRLIVIDESFTDEKSKEEAIKKLRHRTSDIKVKVEEMLQSPKLEASELTNEELKNYIHMSFDYENAQINSMEEEVSIPYQIGTRSLLQSVEKLKAEGKFEYY